MADLDRLHRRLVEGSVLLHEVEFHARLLAGGEDTPEVDAAGSHRCEAALVVHVFNVPGLEAARITFEVVQRVGPGFGNPVQVHLEVELFGVAVFDEVIHRHDALRVLFELEVVVMVQGLHALSGGLGCNGVDDIRGFRHGAFHAEALAGGVIVEDALGRYRDDDVFETGGLGVAHLLLRVLPGHAALVAAHGLQAHLVQHLLESGRGHPVVLAVGVTGRLDVFVAQVGHRLQHPAGVLSHGVPEGVKSNATEGSVGGGRHVVAGDRLVLGGAGTAGGQGQQQA